MHKLKKRARGHGHGVSAEEEHRLNLREVLEREEPGKPTLMEFLLSPAGQALAYTFQYFTACSRQALQLARCHFYRITSYSTQQPFGRPDWRPQRPAQHTKQQPMAHFWMNLQSHYDLRRAQLEKEAELRKWIYPLPLAALADDRSHYNS